MEEAQEQYRHPQEERIGAASGPSASANPRTLVRSSHLGRWGRLPSRGVLRLRIRPPTHVRGARDFRGALMVVDDHLVPLANHAMAGHGVGVGGNAPPDDGGHVSDDSGLVVEAAGPFDPS